MLTNGRAVSSTRSGNPPEHPSSSIPCAARAAPAAGPVPTPVAPAAPRFDQPPAQERGHRAPAPGPPTRGVLDQEGDEPSLVTDDLVAGPFPVGPMQVMGQDRGLVDDLEACLEHAPQ